MREKLLSIGRYDTGNGNVSRDKVSYSMIAEGEDLVHRDQTCPVAPIEAVLAASEVAAE